MLKLSKMTDYGMVIMATLARAPRSLFTAAELARETRISAPTVAKLLKHLARSGLVASERGAHGGYRLAQAPESVDVAQIIAALEGPVGLTECTVTRGSCSIENNCGLRGNWQVINRAVNNALADISLAQIAAPLPDISLRLETDTTAVGNPASA